MRQQPTPTRGLPGQTYFATQRALDEIRSRIGSAVSRDAVLNSSQADLALLAAGCHDKPAALSHGSVTGKVRSFHLRVTSGSCV